MNVAELFTGIAPSYDRLNHLLSLNLDRRWRRALVARARLPERPVVLDACTGTADLAIELALRVPGASITGIDFSEGMLELGRRKAASLPLRADLTLAQGDVMGLPFADGSFDLVTVGFGLRNLPERERGLAEMRRLLRPGGQLLILEFAPPAPGLLGALFRLYLAGIVPWIGGRVSGSKPAYRYLFTSIVAFPPPGRVQEMMRSAGLVAVEAFALSGGLVYLYSGLRPPAG